ncbi:MAG: hypothetical protein KKB70_06620 [Proteobacteria bacterium]|nr:hypothetical protein [Pseudomonadota bacterium]MBU1611714.1 hypothetical protein [Pseudomonadota bacterium]
MIGSEAERPGSSFTDAETWEADFFLGDPPPLCYGQDGFMLHEVVGEPDWSETPVLKEQTKGFLNLIRLRAH